MSEPNRRVIATAIRKQGMENDHFKDARGLHKKLMRLLHRFPEVVATDVGILVEESTQTFKEQVGIRIHVREKLSPAALKFKGMRDLSCEDLTPLLKNYQTMLIHKDNAERIILPQTDEGLKKIRSLQSEADDETSGGLRKYRLNVLTGENGTVAVPIDIISVRYFPSAKGLQVGPPVPNSILRDQDLQRLSRHRVEPLVGGVSLGNVRGSVGTLSAIVWDTTDGRPCILSNWHVLAAPLGSQKEQPCYQPALADGGHLEDQVGVLKRWLFDRRGDAALAELAGNRFYCPSEILGLRHPIAAAIQPELGMRVYKWGRSSDFTRGFIDGIDLTLNVEYVDVGLRHYEGQVHIAPIDAGKEVSIPGDSGALWVTKTQTKQSFEANGEINNVPQVDMLNGIYFDKKKNEARRGKVQLYCAVGLHFAGDVPGSPLGEHAVATPLSALTKELNFSFRPVFPHPDYVVVPQGRLDSGRAIVPSPLTPQRRPAEQIDTGFRQDDSGGHTGSEPITGHP